ncbi:MAG: YceI family protein [Saprospiraceae bacterium]|nr:YceI family protein [Saprospiraceae bacterium]
MQIFNLSLRIIFTIISVFVIHSAFAQKYFSKNAVIRFNSPSKAEKIEGVNTTATTVLDLSSGKLEFAALVNAFVFEKALMQEHFNENYLESSKFPKASFKGSLTDQQSLDFSKPGTYKTQVRGELTMHGVTKSIAAPVEFIVDAKGIHALCSFEVKCSDFSIEIPAVVKNTVSNNVTIKVKVDYKAL